MGYQGLQRRLQNYEQSVPEWLQQFMGDYSASPFNDAVLNEIQRRSGDSLNRNLGQVASYYGGAGRGGGGMMGKTMRDVSAENMQRERGDMAGLLNQDYQGWLQRALGASQILGGIQQAGMGGTAQGYGADQSRIASMYGSDRSLEGVKYASDNSLRAAIEAANASRYGTDAYRDIGMGNLNMNRQFGFLDRDYRASMMPWQQLALAGQGIGPILGAYGPRTQSGTQTTWGQPIGIGGSTAQGFLGGGLMGLGGKNA
jgi:hypothetical protein